MADEQTAEKPAEQQPVIDHPNPATTPPPATETAQPETPAAEPATEPEGEPVAVAEEEGEEEESARKPRPGRAERLRARLASISAETAELARQNEELRSALDKQQQGIATGKPGEDRPPTEADYPNDYMAFDRARIAWETKVAVRSELDRQRIRENEARAAVLRQEKIESYEENAAEARERIPDYDKKIQAARDIHVAPNVAAEIMESDRPALIAYYLADKPAQVRELNSLSGRELTRAVARIEAKVHLPKPATATKAPAPPKQVTGAASPTPDYANPAISMEDYVRLRKEEEKRMGGRI